MMNSAVSRTLLTLTLSVLSVACGDDDDAGTGPPATVEVVVSVSGQGSVISSPAGINCATGNTGTCSARFPKGTLVTFSATPAQNWLFKNWGGACELGSSCTVSATTGSVAVSATFTDLARLRVTLSGQGTITSSPEGIRCSLEPGVACTAEFRVGSDVTLNAAPAANWRLYRWGGACSGSGSCVVRVAALEHAVAAQFVPPPPFIGTVAGNGVPGQSGDGGPATAAQISNHPWAVLLDPAGNVYIADTNNQRIRLVDRTGTIRTIAGSGPSSGPTGRTEGAFAGDGGPATQARFDGPTALALDAAGNLFITDEGNQRVRRVGVDGIVTTVAGNGKAGFSGDGGPATQAELQAPEGVGVDAAGSLYIACRFNYRIRKVDSSGIITTVAGTGSPGFGGDGGPAVQASLTQPSGLALDAAGDMYIADRFNHRIRKVAPSGIITTVAGSGTGAGFSGDGGPATQAQLSGPTHVAVDQAGNLYIADRANHRIRKVDQAGIISTIAGTGTIGFNGDYLPPTETQLFYPIGVAVDTAGEVYISDSINFRIRKITTN